MINSETSGRTISIYELIDIGYDFDLKHYTIWNESYREVLNNALLEYFLTREIAYVNPNMWRRKLNSRLDLIMRNKYNALFKAKDQEFNPLYTMELYEDYTHNIQNTTTTNNDAEINYNSSGNGTNTTQQTNNNTIDDVTDTTQTGIGYTSRFPSNKMIEGDLTSDIFVDGANNKKENANSSTNTTNNNELSGTDTSENTIVDKTTNVMNGGSVGDMTESYSKKTIGSASALTFAHAMTQFKEYCEAFSLDQQIFDELEDLFLQVW